MQVTVGSRSQAIHTGFITRALHDLGNALLYGRPIYPLAAIMQRLKAQSEPERLNSRLSATRKTSCVAQA